MEAESIVVTGANRGIGLELVRQLVKLPKPPKYVFATYRSSDTIQGLEEIRSGAAKTEVVLIKMDIRHAEDIKRARAIIEEKVRNKGLNLLINNAGALKGQRFPDVTEENMLFHFNTNTLGPLNVFKEMLPVLQKSSAQKATAMSMSHSGVLNISSMGGSIGRLNTEEPREWLMAVGYRVSKAALNMTMKMAALEIQEQGILVVQMCPGWVKTDMGSDQAEIHVSQSVSEILHTLPQLNESHHGGFYDRNGNVIPY